MLPLQLLRIWWMAGSDLLHTTVLAGHIWIRCFSSWAPARTVHHLGRQRLAVRWHLHEAHSKVLLDYSNRLLELDDRPINYSFVRWDYNAKPSGYSCWNMHLWFLQWHWRDDHSDRPQ